MLQALLLAAATGAVLEQRTAVPCPSNAGTSWSFGISTALVNTTHRAGAIWMPGVHLSAATHDLAGCESSAWSINMELVGATRANQVFRPSLMCVTYRGLACVTPSSGETCVFLRQREQIQHSAVCLALPQSIAFGKGKVTPPDSVELSSRVLTIPLRPPDCVVSVDPRSLSNPSNLICTGLGWLYPGVLAVPDKSLFQSTLAFDQLEIGEYNTENVSGITPETRAVLAMITVGPATVALLRRLSTNLRWSRLMINNNLHAVDGSPLLALVPFAAMEHTCMPLTRPTGAPSPYCGLAVHLIRPTPVYTGLDGTLLHSRLAVNGPPKFVLATDGSSYPLLNTPQQFNGTNCVNVDARVSRCVAKAETGHSVFPIKPYVESKRYKIRATALVTKAPPPPVPPYHFRDAAHPEPTRWSPRPDGFYTAVQGTPTSDAVHRQATSCVAFNRCIHTEYTPTTDRICGTIVTECDRASVTIPSSISGGCSLCQQCQPTETPYTDAQILACGIAFANEYHGGANSISIPTCFEKPTGSVCSEIPTALLRDNGLYLTASVRLEVGENPGRRARRLYMVDGPAFQTEADSIVSDTTVGYAMLAAVTQDSNGSNCLPTEWFSIELGSCEPQPACGVYSSKGNATTKAMCAPLAMADFFYTTFLIVLGGAYGATLAARIGIPLVRDGGQ